MNILKKLFLLFFLISSLKATVITPKHQFVGSGAVTDLVIQNNKLYVSTAASSVDIFNLDTKELEKKVLLPKIKDFMGDIINSKVYSVDTIDEKILILSQGESGGRNIFMYENDKLITIIPDTKRLFISRAKFLDKNRIIYSLLSNQLFLYDIEKKKNIYFKQVSQSKFSYFSLSEDKKTIVIADESGNLKLLDTQNGELIKEYKNENLDNVFQTDFKNGKILTAGQDRQSVFYSENKTYFKESNFLVYSCALNNKGTLGAYSSNENNDVTIFNTITQKELVKLTGNKMTLSKILFINDNEILVASDDKNINYYKLKD